MLDNDIFDAFGTTTKVAARSKKRKKKDDELSIGDLPPLSPEEEQSLLDRALGGGVSGLQWLGETLDKPRRALYGALAGSREALNIIPFSDSMGLTDPNETITGRDALEAAGILGKNTDGLDLGDVAGFLFELPTDPANWVSFGAKSAAGAAANAGADIGMSAIKKANAIRAGKKSFARITTPDIGIPFTSIGIKPRTLSIGGKPLEWTGENAANAYEALNYSKFSPVPYVRKVFSKNEYLTHSGIGQQKAMDEFNDSVDYMKVKQSDDILELTKLNSEAVKAYEKLRTEKVFGGDEGIKIAKAKAVSGIAAIDPAFKKIVDQRLEPIKTFDDTAPGVASAGGAKANEELAKLYDEAQDIKSSMGKTGERMLVELRRIREEAIEGMQNAPVSEQHWWNDTLSQLMESKPGPNGLSLDDYAAKLKDAGYEDSLASFSETTKAYDQFVGYMRNKLPELEGAMRKAGINFGKFVDPQIAYAPRSATKKYTSQAADFINESRTTLLGRMSRFTVNKMARMFAGMAGDTKLQDDFLKNSDFNSADGVRVVRPPAKNSPMRAAYDEAMDAGVDFADVQDAMREARAAERETKQFKRDAFLSTAEEYLGGKQWPLYVRNLAKAAGANFDATKIPRFDELVRTVSYKMGSEGFTDNDFADEVFQMLTHPQPVNQFSPRKLADKSLIREAIDRAASNKAGRKAVEDDISFDPDMFEGKVAGPATKATKFSTEIIAEALVKEGVPWNGNFDANLRKAIENHPDPDFSSLAKNVDLDDEQFKLAIKGIADQKGFTDAYAQKFGQPIDTADDLLDAMNSVDDVVKNSGGHSWQEIKDLASWFTKLPKEVRDTGFYDRDVVGDVADYIRQAHHALAQTSMVRAIFKHKDFVAPLGTNGADISIFDVWKSAGMTDEGLLHLMAEMRGQNYDDMLKNQATPEAAIKYNESLLNDAKAKGVDGTVARAVIRTGKVFHAHNEPSWLGKLADRFRAITQASLYVPWIASHNRNHIGAAAINYLGNVFSAESYMAAYKMFRGKNLDDPFIKEAIRQAVATGILKTSHPSGYTSQEYLEDLMKAADNPGGFIAGKSVFESVTDPMKVMMGEVAETYKAKGIMPALRQAMIGGTTPSGSQATGLLNFWEVRGGISPGDFKRQVSAVDSRGRQLDMLDRAKSTETRVLPMKMGEQLGAYVEFQARMAPFLHMLKNGWNPHAAALKVKELHFDYGDLNSFEKKVLRRNILFYDFMRKNLELQFKLLTTQPGGRTAQVVRAENRLQEEAKGKDGYIPSHLREGMSIRLPGEVPGFPGTSTFVTQSGLLPIDEAVGRFQFDREGFPLAIRRTAEKFASQLAPWFSAPIEQFSQKQLATGRPLKDLYQYPVGDPEVDFWLNKLPVSRAISTVRTLSDPRKSAGQKAYNLLVGGSRITNVDVPMTKMLEGRRAVQENLASDKDIGQYEALYARDVKSLMERAKNGDDNALMQLQLYNQLRQNIRKTREKAKK